MPRNVDEWCSNIKAVEKEYAAVRLALDRLLAKPWEDDLFLQSRTEIGHIENASRLLEGTYLIRLFAEFETGLRICWETRRTSHPRMQDLVESLAANHGVPTDWIEAVHSVRKYRNGLVHEREDIAAPCLDR